jgi:hypothetical protein
VEIVLWPGLVVIALILLIVRVRIDVIPEFHCPNCRNIAEGRRCYQCRLEADPDEDAVEMGVREFVVYEAKDLWRVHVRKQKWRWSPF